MSMATMSVMGIYEYDNSLFDKLTLPDGIDRENVISNILMETAELEVIYPNIVVFKMAIHHWSKKNCPIWQKLKETTEYEYNPIFNTDRTYYWEDVTTEKCTTDGDEATGSTSNGTSRSHSQNGGSDNNEQKVSAYNSSEYQPRQQDTTTYGQTNNVDGESKLEENGTRNYNESNDRSEQHIHKEKAEGNIGVTTTQQMIKEEREVVKFNIIDYIVDDFKRRFCLLIY